MTEIIVAVITGIATVAAVVITNKKSNALIAYRLEQLEKKVDKHNTVIERTYALEKTTAVLEDKIKSAQHRLDDLEGKV